MQGKNSIENLKTYADFSESLGIIKKWQDGSKGENPDLLRLAELQLNILKSHSLMSKNIRDLEEMNSFIRSKKNEEILALRDELNKYKL